MVRIWNEVVEAGDAFPQVTPLTNKMPSRVFSAQTATMVADMKQHHLQRRTSYANSIGRCAHIANASSPC